MQVPKLPTCTWGHLRHAERHVPSCCPRVPRVGSYIHTGRRLEYLTNEMAGLAS